MNFYKNLQLKICSRKSQKCPFKLATRIETKENKDGEIEVVVGGPHKIEYMYKQKTHTCYQDPLQSLKQKFRNAIKSTLSNDFRAKYTTVYQKEKIKLLRSIDDNDLKERVRQILPTENSLRTAANNAKRLPRAPKSLNDIVLEVVDTEDLKVSDYLLGSSPEDGIYLFGTKTLAKEFANSLFKSADATFKICPKLFYQVMIFLALINGVYVNCMMAVMPNEKIKKPSQSHRRHSAPNNFFR